MNFLFKILTLLLFIVFAQETFSAPVTDGVVAYWQFNDGDYDDSVTAGNSQLTAQFMGNAICQVDPSQSSLKFGRSLYLDGDYDYLIVDDYIDNNYILSFSQEFTFTMWIKNENETTGFYKLLEKWTDPTDQRQYIFAITGHSLALYQTGNIALFSSSQSDIFDGWHQVTAVRRNISGSTYNLELYYDGTLVGSKTTTRSLTSANFPLMIGAGHYDELDPTRIFEGYMDEIKMFNRALSTEEILEDYNWVMDGNDLSGSGTPIPEPASFILLGLLATIFGCTRLKKRK